MPFLGVVDPLACLEKRNLRDSARSISRCASIHARFHTASTESGHPCRSVLRRVCRDSGHPPGDLIYQKLDCWWLEFLEDSLRGLLKFFCLYEFQVKPPQARLQAILRRNSCPVNPAASRISRTPGGRRCASQSTLCEHLPKTTQPANLPILLPAATRRGGFQSARPRTRSQ
jgi:hypothetical protein